MKTLPIPPGTYPLDSPEVAKLLNKTPEEMQQIAENVRRSAENWFRNQAQSSDNPPDA